MIGPDFGRSSFHEYLERTAPDLLPGGRATASGGGEALPHGTTIIAVAYPGGVLLAGDRRATAGHLIASRDIRKVFLTDDHTAVGIAGTAGIAVEMVRLFTVELEHYEKIEGVPLSFDGKANRLAAMVRGNLGAALQGLAAIPLLVGAEPASDVSASAVPASAVPASATRAPGRIVSFDAAGGRYEERAGYHAIGSGSMFARSALKKLYEGVTDEATALDAAIAALYDAADDDSATGGPDVARGLFPLVARVTPGGAIEVPEERIRERSLALLAARTERGEG